MHVKDFGESQLAEFKQFLKDLDSRLLEETIKSSEQISRYLFLINAGGTIAVLSFMGASEKIRELPAAKFCLKAFLLGLICAVLMAATQYFFSSQGLRVFRKETASFWNGETKSREMLDNIEKKVLGLPLRRQMFLWGWGSLASFFACAGVVFCTL